jgi:hypothetical protein
MMGLIDINASKPATSMNLEESVEADKSFGDEFERMLEAGTGEGGRHIHTVVCISPALTILPHALF